jgi:hypothetical protein
VCVRPLYVNPGSAPDSTVPIAVVGPVVPITAALAPPRSHRSLLFLGRSRWFVGMVGAAIPAHPSLKLSNRPYIFVLPSSSHKVTAGPNLRLHAWCITLLTTPPHTHFVHMRYSFFSYYTHFIISNEKVCHL